MKLTIEQTKTLSDLLRIIISEDGAECFSEDVLELQAAVNEELSGREAMQVLATFRERFGSN